ncbi:MAG: hypothetical protein HQ539_02675 [Parcubacteria group bacterium]|nr:hypothetical protein [Parcubacteria group bacterium]
MNKVTKTIFVIIPLIILALFSYTLKQQGTSSEIECGGDADLHFFFSESCSVCARTSIFLNNLEQEYPELRISKCNLSEEESVEKLLEFYAEYDVPREKYGTVPIIFLPDKYLVGFGDSYANALQEYAGLLSTATTTVAITAPEEVENVIRIPVLGEVDAKQYSLPVLAIALGFFDGFNVCSLGALVMILGLILVLRNRKRILLFGGAFIVTTGLVYGLLIVLWYNLFVLLAPFLKIMEVLIGILGIAGGIYFLKDFIKFRKQGPTCDIATGQTFMSKFSAKLQDTLENRTSIIAIILSILLFAVVITVVEFPCSAAVPLFFAGTLAEAGLPAWQYLSYIALFILFYMIDEIVIFLIAVFTMTIKLASKKFVVWITLVEAIVLFALGLYYLFGFLIFR